MFIMSRFEQLLNEFDVEELEGKFLDSLTTEEIDILTDMRNSEDNEKFVKWGEETGKELVLQWATEHDNLPDEELIVGGIVYGMRKFMEYAEVV